MANLLLGGVAGTVAATVCYPLDTIRRRMQMKGRTYSSQLDAFAKIYAQEGVRGFYRGWAANTIKVVPQNAIRFVRRARRVGGVRGGCCFRHDAPLTQTDHTSTHVLPCSYEILKKALGVAKAKTDT